MLTRTPGSLATYTCNSGYELVGNGIRTCLASGVWSGTEPFCSQGIHFGISVTEHSNSYAVGHIGLDLLHVYTYPFYSIKCQLQNFL